MTDFQASLGQGRDPRSPARQDETYIVAGGAQSAGRTTLLQSLRAHLDEPDGVDHE